MELAKNRSETGRNYTTRYPKSGNLQIQNSQVVNWPRGKKED